jgi:hypothetical protein
MVDKSWGVSGSTTVRVRTNDTDGRAAERADARASRSTERAAAMAQRQDERSARRDEDAHAREQARTERREQEQRLAAGDPHAAAAQRRRSSGRRDVVREQRDTSGYATVIDHGRIRELARRGATVPGLAAVFGVTEQEIAQALIDTDGVADG